MENSKIVTYLTAAVVLITATMFIWTINYISACNNTNLTPAAIAAFNA